MRGVEEQTTTLYIIRHGQSGENDGSDHGGDSALSETGTEQARRTGAWLASDPSRNPVPGMIYSSPARRAIETAREIADPYASPIAVEPDVCEYGMLYEDPGLGGTELLSLAPRAMLPADFPDERAGPRRIAVKTRPKWWPGLNDSCSS